ncbi:bis(5'-nucleosyl)-tetraphosphatase (symmetrical) YqeK [Paenibacillus ginsengarvi]|uniref:HD domain-containing protein n=1 Tax=Paenibacillus ginsengarvi TaxID=400777 RepID=A0A3B0BHJ7_9BACL|nr:bis(5'-nucleosyl)-tetraphosphatase (symmetrical) YqeK [Paenibacillus ginsengarvi]RKN72372.1 HD domain-containing protein [Paenibacillus ginsengarvi]
MHPFFASEASFRPSGDLALDVRHFLEQRGCPKTAEHSIAVGAEARSLAIRFGADPAKAEAAGWLHDISAIYPSQDRIRVARELGVDVLPEEETFPMIVHQKLSVEVARHLFGVDDQDVLDAIGCHTTLKAPSTLLDRVVFVADKIAWDQAGTPPYLSELNARLELSLEHGAMAYIGYLWERKETLKVVHPWLADAYADLRDAIARSDVTLPLRLEPH